VVLAVLRAQWADHRERFPYQFKAFGLIDEEGAYATEMVRDPRQSGKLAQGLIDVAGTNPGRSPAIIEDAGKSDPNGLLIILCVDRNVSLSKRALDRIGRKDSRKVFCVLLDEGGFTQGFPSSEPETPPKDRELTSMNAHSDPSKATVIGYAERGLVNALVQHIKGDQGMVKQFLGSIQWKGGKSTESRFVEMKIRRVHWIVESGFSQFGDPDLILLVHPVDSSVPLVFFIEAKVIEYAVSAKSNEHGMSDPGFNSSINGQLSLKYRLARALMEWDVNKASQLKPIEEPQTLTDKARILKDNPKRRRRLRKKANLALFKQLFYPEAQSGSEIHLENCFFVALTIDKKGPREMFDPNCLDDEPYQPFEPFYFPTEEPHFARLARRYTGWCGWSNLKDTICGLGDTPEFSIVFEPVLQTWKQRKERAVAGRSGSAIRTTAWTTIKDARLKKLAKAIALQFVNLSKKFPSRMWADETEQTGSWSITVQGQVVAKIIPRLAKPENHLLVAVGSDNSVQIPSYFSEKDVLINGRPFSPAMVPRTLRSDDDSLTAAIEEYFEDLSHVM